MWYQPSASIAAAVASGLLPVAGEAAGAAGQDLAVVGDPDLDAGDRLADRPEPVPLRAG